MSEHFPGQMEGGQEKRRESRMAGVTAPVPFGVGQTWMDGRPTRVEGPTRISAALHFSNWPSGQPS